MTEQSSTFFQWINEARQDIRYTIRQHRRAPGLALLIVLTLAIGIGANVSMAGAIDRLLLRAPPLVSDPGQIVRFLLVSSDPTGGVRASSQVSYPTFLDIKRDASKLQSVAAYFNTTVSFGVGPDAVEATAALVSSSYFSLLGVNPQIGRLFIPSDDDNVSAEPNVILSDGFWRRRFGGDRNVLGHSVRIGKLSYTISGVAPVGFFGIETEPTEVWLPLTVAAESESTIPIALTDRGSFSFSLLARLKRHSSTVETEKQVSEIWRTYNSPAYGVEPGRRFVLSSLIRGRGPDRSREVNVALWLTGVSEIVLLIACCNVANLLLSRAFVRRREIGIRLALGAGIGRLARQLFAEAFLLAMAGATGALYLIVLGGRLLSHLMPTELPSPNFIDLRLLLITLLIAVATAVLISLAPLMQAAAADLTHFTRGTITSGGHSSRVRATLLVAQAAFCMLLLVGAGLFAQSFRRVNRIDLGIDLRRTLMVKVDLNRISLSRSELEATSVSIREKLLALPDVKHVAFSEKDPYKYGRAVAAHTPARTAESLWHIGIDEVPMEVAVDSGFFSAIGAKSLLGRDFLQSDRFGAPPVAIINETLARILWPGEDPIGQCMLMHTDSADCVTVVGVTQGFLKTSILSRDRLVVYVPMAQSGGYSRAGTIFVAVRGEPANTSRSIRETVQNVRPDLPAVSVRSMADVIDPEFRPWRLAATMFTVFGCIALFIAVIGLYGVVSFAAAQRSSEIAVRIALGAQVQNILRVVALDALKAVLAGVTIGSIVALAARRWVGPLLFQTSAKDPGIIIGIGCLLLLVALSASLIPTFKTFLRNPASVLRVD